ncbi:MAG: hypothetical protein NTV16_03120 [Actinobacteria bacterium]|nr:hypothetical protein [Actinomycetota bacterium]
MINHQALRESFKSEKIKVLFIAEAPPKKDTFFYSAKPGFYNYTKQIFNELFKEEINRSADFLHFFQDKGCFLDDLCHEPKTYEEICKNKDDKDGYIKKLQCRLKSYNPQAIIITPKEINDLVHEAIKKSNITLSSELIFTLYFPGNGWQNDYMSGLWGVLHFLITKNILT